jgi:phage terminase large subunit-like protein
MLPLTAKAQEYIDAVLSGEQVVGPFILKALQRHVRDLDRTDFNFNPEAGQRVIDFLETFCVPSAQTEPMKLMPWQKAMLYIVYGWLRLDGYRRFHRVYVEIGKKNGKSGLLAGLVLYHLVADGELSARVFVAAVAQKQAREVFSEAVAMRDKNPELSVSDHLKTYFSESLPTASEWPFVASF